MDAAHIAEAFRRRFGEQPLISSAPGRVNLIGEHTDYNDGFVLPCAIGFTTRAAISPRSDTKLVFQSTEFDRPFEFDLRDLPAKGLGMWSDYVLGVAITLRDAGYRVGGANLLFHGEVPMGAGLSSSAAIEVASALAFLSLADTPFDLPRVAKLCQRAENEFVGARVGIMDQFVSCLGKRGNALLLDCRSLDFQLVPISDQVKLVISNTMVKHEHSGGEYNQRRLECEEGVRILARFLPGIKALRDVTPDELACFSGSMPPVIYRRCLHVVEENRRVLRSVDCLRSNDFEGMGRLMRASHVSLRDLYQVSCRELDLMVESASGLPGYYGGRMTGGGFGGSTVNLVSAAAAAAFREELAKRYRDETGISPEIYICSPADGAHLEQKATPV